MKDEKKFKIMGTFIVVIGIIFGVIGIIIGIVEFSFSGILFSVLFIITSCIIGALYKDVAIMMDKVFKIEKELNINDDKNTETSKEKNGESQEERNMSFDSLLEKAKEISGKIPYPEMFVIRRKEDEVYPVYLNSLEEEFTYYFKDKIKVINEKDYNGEDNVLFVELSLEIEKASFFRDNYKYILAFFDKSGEGKYACKSLNTSSDLSIREVINMAAEKFE